MTTENNDKVWEFHSDGEVIRPQSGSSVQGSRQDDPPGEPQQRETTHKPQQKSKARIGVKPSVRTFLSGNILSHPEVSRKLPYALFVAGLMFLYIANGYHIQKLHRQYIRLNNEVKELRTKSLSYNERRMTATRQSQILLELERRGILLEESVTPPIIIEK